MLSGTLTRIPSFYNDVYKFTSWGSGVAFSDKLLQLVNAAGLALLRPLGAPMIDANGIPRYNTAPVTGVDWIGVCVLVIIIISLIINRKNRFTWACGLCVLLSLIVELVIGWGAGTYSMVVYSYYFSWAYVALICMALFEIFKRYPKIQTVVFTALILVVSVVNFTELIKALSFGIEYYPFY